MPIEALSNTLYILKFGYHWIISDVSRAVFPGIARKKAVKPIENSNSTLPNTQDLKGSLFLVENALYSSNNNIPTHNKTAICS